MTRAELIDLLVQRRLDTENAKRAANRAESVTGWMLEQGRQHEIDYILGILRTNLINGD